MKLQNKVVLIVGGTSGLGLEIGELLLEKGCIVHALGKSVEGIKKAVEEIGDKNLATYQCDVTDAKQIDSLMREIGKVDVLINAAAVWIEGSVQDNTVEEISEAIDVNLKGVIFTTRAVLPQMVKRNDGFIVNIVTTTGLKGRSGQTVYSASKFGVTGFTQSLQEDLKETNVKVVGLYPGGMRTKFFEKAGKHKENSDWMDPAKVAEIVVFMIERDDSLYMDQVVVNKRMIKTSN